MADLYSILACPTCKVSVERQDDRLHCPQCNRTFPIVNGVPIMLPDGVVTPSEYQHQLHVRNVYEPWVQRAVIQSLPTSAIMLEMGAGNMELSLPNVVRTDVTLTPYVDVVADAHMLPFLPGTFDFVFSQAVVEHLRQPFVAAQEMYDVLRDGGYVYGDCNFVFAYHGYPHHYFNASEQGLEQVFARFEKLRTGVAPFQMPSFALKMVLTTYLSSMSPTEDPQMLAFRIQLRDVLDQPLTYYDAAFTEQGAFNVAAGTFFFGRKTTGGPTDVIPPAVQHIWAQQSDLQARFPNLFDIGRVPNVMLWARHDGREQFGVIDDFYRGVVPFRKDPNMDDSGRATFDALPELPTDFAAIPDDTPPEPVLQGDAALIQRLAKVAARNEELVREINGRDAYIKKMSAAFEETQTYARRLEAHIAEKEQYTRALEGKVRALYAQLDRAGIGVTSRLKRLIRTLRRR